MRVPHIGIRLALEVVLGSSYDPSTPQAVVSVVDALGEERLEVSLVLCPTWRGAYLLDDVASYRSRRFFKCFPSLPLLQRVLDARPVFELCSSAAFEKEERRVVSGCCPQVSGIRFECK